MKILLFPLISALLISSNSYGVTQDKYNYLKRSYNKAQHENGLMMKEFCTRLSVNNFKPSEMEIFSIVTGIKKYGLYVDLDRLDQVFDKALTGDRKSIGNLLEAMMQIREVENKILNLSSALVSAKNLNNRYLACLASAPFANNLDEKLEIANNLKIEITTLLESVDNSNREVSDKLDTYLEIINNSQTSTNSSSPQ